MNKNTKLKFGAVLKKNSIQNLAAEIADKFLKSEIFLVGGSVRDVFLGRPIKDIDILIRKVKLADLEKFLSKLGKVNLVGQRFSVLKFTGKDGVIDIAIPRTDFSFGTGGYKDVKVKSNPNLSVEEDLARRDFTVNAMAWNILENELVDLFGGVKDLKSKIIRTVGKPKERFSEDYSRMLRAIRFAMQLGFEIEPQTMSAVKKYISHINDTTPPPPPLTKGGKRKAEERKVPYETIASEFLKSFEADPAQTIKIYMETGAAKRLLPEIYNMKGCSQPRTYHSEGDVFDHTMLALSQLDSPLYKKYFKTPASITTKIAVLLHDIGKPAAKTKKGGKTVFYNHDKMGAEMAKKLLTRLKLSSPPKIGVDSEQIVWMIKNHLLFLYSDPQDLKKTTLEKYLFNERYRGDDFLKMYFADASASRPDGKKSADLSRFKTVMKIVEGMKKGGGPKLPLPILNGDEIMKILKLRPGPKIGEVIEYLREEQLAGRIKTKKEAESFIVQLNKKISG